MLLQVKKNIEAEKKITDLTSKVTQISEKVFYFLLGKMYFTDSNVYQNFLVLAPMLSFIKVDSNKEFHNWISTEISNGKIKPFYINL